MTHRFPIKEISVQSGLSTATVDRVLNDRPNVSAQSRARVAAAIEELEGQAAQLAARGRRLFVDVVVEAPLRFSREIRAGSERALPRLHPVILRPRFAFHEVMSPEHVVTILTRIEKRGSHGVCLKAQDTAPVRRAIDQLAQRGIPVVTLFTDCPETQRLAYVGLDNRRAGQTAARLMARHVQSGRVLALQSHRAFEGEEERLQGFRDALNRHAPNLEVALLRDAHGLDTGTGSAVEQALPNAGGFAGVYSVGGGNRAVVLALGKAGQKPGIYIAHDLDQDNLALLSRNEVDYVLHHDLEADMEIAFRHLMGFHKLIAPVAAVPSDVQIVIAENIPHRFRQ